MRDFFSALQTLWLKAQLSRRVTAQVAVCRTLKSVDRKPRLFALEPLESRMLLSADLTGVISSAAPIDPAVPTNTASAAVQVLNVGNHQADSSQVAIYASLDTKLDTSDVLLGSTNIGKLNAGASKNVTVDFTIPNTIDPGPYRLLAKVDNAGAITENSETNTSANAMPIADATRPRTGCFTEPPLMSRAILRGSRKRVYPDNRYSWGRTWIEEPFWARAWQGRQWSV